MHSSPSDEHLEALQRRAKDFADHENVSEATVRDWYEQFAEKDRDLAVKVLENIKYVSTANIRGKARELLLMIQALAKDEGWKKVHIIPVGGADSGSSVVVRAMKGEIKSRKIKGATISSLFEIQKLKPGDVDCVFIVDDFVGTGRTFTEWWETMAESLLLPLQAVTAIGVLVAAHEGMSPLESVSEHVFVGDELGEEDNVFSAKSRVLTEDLKNGLLDYCKKTGCSNEYVTGLGGCGLLVAFKHVCPNNSLPILWHATKPSKTKKGWRALFRRQGL